MNNRRLEYLTQPEVADQLKRNPLVILPAGSVEQHGPHLPAGTDIFAANIIAEAVAEKMDGLVIPGGPLGVTPFHMPFEATITLSHETYIRVVVETCQSLAQHGARRLMILNWHEGNSSSLAMKSPSPESGFGSPRKSKPSANGLKSRGGCAGGDSRIRCCSCLKVS